MHNPGEEGIPFSSPKADAERVRDAIRFLSEHCPPSRHDIS
jgi:hypothetical protein